MSEAIVAVLGNIGAGKSEFINSMNENRLSSRLLKMLPEQSGLNIFEESEKVKEVVANFFYPAFARGDMRLCYAAEIEMLHARKDWMLDIARAEGLSLIERTIYENRFVFFENLYRTGMMKSPFYDNYCDTFERLAQLVPVPDVFVYLKTSPDIVYERMLKRGRESEKGVPLDYLQKTHALYEELVDKVLPNYIPTYGVKLVRVDANKQLNDQELRKFHNQIEEKIEHALRRQGWGKQ